MDIEKFRKMVTDPRRTKKDLIRILETARSRGSEAHAAIAVNQLHQRFPDWDIVKYKKGGPTPNWPVFRGERRTFNTAKEGYIWLIERFISERPELFKNPSNETLFVALGKSRNCFGRNPKSLFKGSPHLADNPSNYQRLSNGWYANLNLSNAQKFDIRLRFGALAHLEYPVDWKWEVSGATQLLVNKQQETIQETIEVKRLLDELPKLSDAD
jgi:hypothetical protein